LKAVRTAPFVEPQTSCGSTKLLGPCRRKSHAKRLAGDQGRPQSRNRQALTVGALHQMHSRRRVKAAAAGRRMFWRFGSGPSCGVVVETELASCLAQHPDADGRMQAARSASSSFAKAPPARFEPRIGKTGPGQHFQGSPEFRGRGPAILCFERRPAGNLIALLAIAFAAAKISSATVGGEFPVPPVSRPACTMTGSPAASAGRSRRALHREKNCPL